MACAGVRRRLDVGVPAARLPRLRAARGGGGAGCSSAAPSARRRSARTVCPTTRRSSPTTRTLRRSDTSGRSRRASSRARGAPRARMRGSAAPRERSHAHDSLLHLACLGLGAAWGARASDYGIDVRARDERIQCKFDALPHSHAEAPADRVEVGRVLVDDVQRFREREAAPLVGVSYTTTVLGSAGAGGGAGAAAPSTARRPWRPPTAGRSLTTIVASLTVVPVRSSAVHGPKQTSARAGTAGTRGRRRGRPSPARSRTRFRSAARTRTQPPCSRRRHEAELDAADGAARVGRGEARRQPAAAHAAVDGVARREEREAAMPSAIVWSVVAYSCRGTSLPSSRRTQGPRPCAPRARHCT